MLFIESRAFTEDVTALLSDDEYALFQRYLATHPRAGPVIKDTGGARKVRWRGTHGGKRGGVRVIYYHVDGARQIRLLLIYAKTMQDELSPAQRRVLRSWLERW